MFARLLGIAALLLGLSAAWMEAEAGKDTGVKDKAVKDKGVKDKAAKDVSKEKGKKYEVPKDAVEGTVKSVDLKGETFTIAVDKAKDRTFQVTKTTEFYGPRGGDRGTGPAGLKDDCMEKGYVIHVLASKDGKSALEVHLPVRKSEKAEKDKTAKEKK